MNLEPPDRHHLDAAEGWLGLGDPRAANEELGKIADSLLFDPDVLEIRWSVYAAFNRWEACLDAADALINVAPLRSSGWVCRSYALHEMKRTREAADRLAPAAELFPGHWLIRYNLACYACRLGKVEEAWTWLDRAFDLGDLEQIKQMALGDPDLERFWSEIKRF